MSLVLNIYDFLVQSAAKLRMLWNPGDLVLVAGSAVARSIYINGNIIAKGTGPQIPVALFSPGGDLRWRMDRIMRIRASSMAANESGDRMVPPLFIDDSPHAYNQRCAG